MPKSVSFDRAASFYDRTRALLPESAAAITDAILAQTGKARADSLLEVGIGTGRIARPLMARGLRVAGIDISTEMMGRLRDQLTPDHAGPDLFLADATRLPFRDNSSRASLVVHVLHLVSSIDEAVAEIRRVTAPGGVFLHKVQRDNEPLTASGAWWDEALQRHGHPPLNRLRFQRQRQIIAATGAQLELIEVAHETLRHDPNVVLDLTRNRVHSWTWQIADDTFDACIREYEPWFRDHYTEEIVEETTHELEVWHWPLAPNT